VKNNQISRELRKDLKMKTEIDGKTFIIFNRDPVQVELQHLLGGPWHWGLEDQDGNLRVSRLGMKTEETAMNLMDAYAWAVAHNHELEEHFERELTSLPEGTVVEVKIRAQISRPPRESESFLRTKREFVAAALEEFGLSK
jgi:hypothetical protein